MTEKYLAQVQNLTADLSTDNDGSIQYLLVSLAGREYGVQLASLQEVLRYNQSGVAPVPNTPVWLEGIFSLRGTIISVVSLRVFLGLPRADEIKQVSAQRSAGIGQLFGLGAPIPRLLVLQNNELVVGVVVDDIRGVISVRPESVVPVTDQAHPIFPYLEGAYADSETKKETWLLDVTRLLNSPEMLAFEPVL
ncbi:MAG TPA: chemotaxis protein CheW [Chloroflexia bacterium]|nr:chemotaxis protein CheW [Chloroflexia bacterium]